MIFENRVWSLVCLLKIYNFWILFLFYIKKYKNHKKLSQNGPPPVVVPPGSILVPELVGKHWN